MKRQFDGFDWDQHNQSKILSKHGIHPQDVERAIVHAWFLAGDPKHSKNEERAMAVGPDEKQRPILVIFTYRIFDHRQYIRPISARYMHEKEIQKYKPL